MSTTPVRVRFAPSPTGHLHIGGARTALYNFLIARQTGGQFILRIEDTDQTRFVPGAMEEQMQSLRWLGLQWDEGPDVGGPHAPYIQSQRTHLYQQHAEQLIEEGKAYYCFCTKERLEALRREQQILKRQSRYDGFCRNIPLEEAKARKAAGEPCVVRFKVPQEGSTTVNDLLRGNITVENSTLDDFVIIKSDGTSLYHLAAMVDDHLMDITHVIRSSEWLPSLPKHALIYRSFGWTEPTWVHLSVFLKPSGKGKMSKRDVTEGYSILVKDLPALGYLPEAVLNWIVLMGWSLDDKTEFFNLPDMIKWFSLDRLNPSPAAVNFEKFDHFNGLHIRALPADELARRLRPFFAEAGLPSDEETLVKLVPLIQERLVTLDDGPEKVAFLFKADVDYDPTLLIQKGMDAAGALAVLQRVTALLQSLPDLNHTVTEPLLRALATELNLKPAQFFGVLRVALTGQTVSPPLLETIAVMERKVVFTRLAKAEQALATA